MLHTEEFEILLPNRKNLPNEQPLFLSLGSAFTMIIPTLLMGILSSRIYQGSNQSFVYISLITGGTGALMGAMWTILNQGIRKKNAKKEDEALTTEYDRYLSLTEKRLLAAREENRDFMLNRYPGGKWFLERVDEAFLFKKFFKDDDYLFIRYSLGRCPFQMNIKISEGQKNLFPTEDLQKARELKSKFLELDGVPLCLDLGKNRIIGLNLSQDEETTYEYILGLLIQAAGLFNPAELKICLFYSDDNEYQRKTADCIKWFPHVFTEGRKERLIAGNPSSTARIGLAMEEILDNKKAFALVLVLSDRYLAEETVYQKLTSCENDLKYSSILLKKQEYLPPGTGLVLNEENINFEDEKVSFKEAACFNSKISSIKTDGIKGDEAIPSKVDFFSLFDARNLKELEVGKKWARANPGERLKVPIGITDGNMKQYLDVHEKYHGPHGLVAGTTGSGKSELLQTYLMSLCISFSPNQVNFFLIDYKGGGTGNYISALPHCAGTISNLSGSQIERAMKAIGSENRRRQRLLSQYGVNHVDAYSKLYEKGEVENPMPHLILIVDEFAELKKEEPEFMQQIITLAAVGRSLGIHLILATQKPAGVVDDKIWSNSHFKLCLKVQDRQDSMDMLHRPEAATLKNPGQCYVQIGNNEYFRQFQTGYLGGRYDEKGEGEPDMYLLDETGMRMYLPKGRTLVNAPLKIEALVNYVNSVAKEIGYSMVHHLWMEELPTEISLSEIVEAEKKSDVFWLGRYDDPSNQMQGNINYVPCRCGHMAIAGGPSTGKTTMLKTLISQVGVADEFLLVDLSQNGIFQYEFRSNCLGTLKDISEIPVFFYHLAKEFEFRKKCRPDHDLYVFVDNFQSLYRLLDEDKTDLLNKMAAEGIGAGIYFILCGNSPADFPSRIFSKIKTAAALEMNDHFMYGDMLRKFRLNVSPRENTPGRFLYNVDGEVLECQCALPDMIMPEGRREHPGEHPREHPRRFFPKIPQNPMLDDFNNYAKTRLRRDVLYIGYSLKSGYQRGICLQKGGSFTISGARGSGRHTLLRNMAQTLEDVNGFDKDNIYYFSGREVEKEKAMKADVILCEDLGQLARSMCSREADEELNRYIMDGVNMKNGILLAGIYDSQRDMDVMASPLFSALMRNGQGIHLGGNAAAQRMLDISDLSYSESSRVTKKGFGLMKVNGHSNTLTIRVPSGEEVKGEDFD